MSKRMVDYKVENGKIVSIDGYEVGGGGDYQIKELVVTENGVYDVAGEVYKPVRVNVPQTAQSGTLKALLDATHSSAYLFYNYSGTTIDGLISSTDTANVTDMTQMFRECVNLNTIPVLDTSKVTNMSGMFNSCYNLTTIPTLDTSKVTNMIGMFYNCRNLTSIPALDASSADTTNIFADCTSLSSIGMYGFRYSINISSTALEHDALVAFLNQAGTASNGAKITMGSAKLALLSDEEKAIATNKGWTLA